VRIRADICRYPAAIASSAAPPIRLDPAGHANKSGLGELREAVRGLIGRLPGLRLVVPASELEIKPGMAIHSLRELPVRWDES
jgi:hypothetical protein